MDGDAAEVQTGGGVELSVARGGVCHFDRQFKIFSSANKTSTPDFICTIFFSNSYMGYRLP